MENGGQGTGGAAGSNGNQAGGVAGGVGGGQAGGAAVTATTTAQSQIATTSGFQTSTTSSRSTNTTATATSSSTAASSSSSGIQNGAIIGGVVGGIAGLIIIALIALWLLRRKKNKVKANRIKKIEPVTYAGLNASFAGVRFGGGAPSPSSTQGHHDSLLPPPLFTPGPNTPNTPNTPNPGVNIRGGETSPYMRDSDAESAQFLHSYAESHSDTMSRTARSSLGRIDTSSNVAHSDTYVSPMTPSFAPLSPVAFQPHKPGLIRQETSDTMGFPRDHDEDLDVLPPMPRIHAPNRDTIDTMNTMDTIDTMGFPLASPHTSVALAAPRPVHPVNQNSLEYQVRSEMSGVESPVLGFHEKQPSRAYNGQQPSQLNKVESYESPVATNPGVSRNMSQRTMASVSDYGPDVISDAELERLGVGLGRRLTNGR